MKEQASPPWNHCAGASEFRLHTSAFGSDGRGCGGGDVRRGSERKGSRWPRYAV